MIAPQRGWDGTSFQASLSDGDGGLTGIAWQWSRSSNRSSWNDISAATGSSYTATTEDVDQYLRATASYEDRRSSNKEASAFLTGRVEDSTDRPASNAAPAFVEDDDLTVLGRTTTRSVSAGPAAGRRIGSAVRATDPDRADVLTYSLTGADADRFDVDAATGQLLTRAVLEHDPAPGADNTHEVTVTVHDGFNASYGVSTAVDDTILVTITVTAATTPRIISPPPVSAAPVNNAPAFLDGEGNAITETTREIPDGAEPETPVGEPVAATDPDGDSLTYTLGGNDVDAFNIHPSTGQLTNRSAPDRELKAEYTVTVTAADASGETAEITVTITVTEVILPCTSGNAVANAADHPDLVADCGALLSMRDTLSGSATLNWSNDVPLAEWDGVSLRGTPTRVFSLDLRGRDLDGEIPTDWSALSGLERLYLDHNRLTGPIPPELAELSNLVHLTLHRNSLSGEIPAELGALAKLTYLSLYGNDLTGEIPDELGNLSNLRWLFLHSNNAGDGGGLSGAIPSALGDLGNLERLFIFGNSLSGAIPAELGNLSNLRSLLAHDNRFTGVIPAELGNLSRLRYLWLDDNDLSGEIPAELGSLSNLQWLSLYGNRLSGEIPGELCDLSALRLLMLDRNNLSGAIPACLGMLSELTWLDLHDNDLSGAIPVELGDLANLEHLYLHDNVLTGPAPAALGRLSKLTNLWLRDNRLSGQIPSALGDLPNLQRVRVAGNPFTGCVPAALMEGPSWFSDAGELDLPPCNGN